MSAVLAQSVLHYLKQHGPINRGMRLYVAHAMRQCRADIRSKQ